MDNSKLNKSNKVKIIVIALLIFFVAIAGITYAYFSIQITGNDTASSLRVTTADLRLVYTDAEIISDSNIEPGWSTTKTITVKNEGNKPVYYSIIWRELLNEITNNELTISATCNSDASGRACPSITESPIPTSTTLVNNISIKNNIEIQPDETHTYTVTVAFIETNSLQNYNQNKQFRGTINIGEGSEPATLSLQTDTGTTGLSTGDVVRATKTGIDNQDFYVVSTDVTNTVLLAKYNLLVGDILDYECVGGGKCTEVYTLNKTLGPSDSGYGLQSSTANGWYDGDTTRQYIGVVPFSGTNYWDDSVCQYTGTSWGCTGTSGLSSSYATNGANYSGNPYPDVYNSSMSTTAPSLDYTNGYGSAQNNEYTIAYYVNQYINTLGINGTGRLLTYEEEQALESSNSSIVFNGQSYWMGSARDYGRVWTVLSDGDVNFDSFADGLNDGVRPVIVVSTPDIGA